MRPVLEFVLSFLARINKKPGSVEILLVVEQEVGNWFNLALVAGLLEIS